MLTPFGIAVRKLRLDRHMRLLDLAHKLGVTPAYVSAVETGRKSIPDGLVEQIVQALNLTESETAEVKRAFDRTKTEVRVDTLGGDNRELVAAFARKVDELPPDIVAKLKEHVFKSENGETPFRRKRRGIVVPPLSAGAIRDFSEQVRSVFVNDLQVQFPIMDVLEFRMEKFYPGFYIDPRTREELGGDEGRSVAGENRIILREDVYRDAWNGNGRARFTACHELAHFLMHRNVSLARTRSDAEPIYRDSEWQADTFAGALLMSKKHLNKFDNADDAAEACGMTFQAADVQWQKYRTK